MKNPKIPEGLEKLFENIEENLHYLAFTEKLDDAKLSEMGLKLIAEGGDGWETVFQPEHPLAKKLAGAGSTDDEEDSK
jgi:hypothetical protein